MSDIKKLIDVMLEYSNTRGDHHYQTAKVLQGQQETIDQQSKEIETLKRENEKLKKTMRLIANNDTSFPSALAYNCLQALEMVKE